MFSTIQDQQSRELSQGHSSHRAKRLKVSEQDVKLPPVLSMDACQVCHSELNIFTPSVPGTAFFQAVSGIACSRCHLTIAK